MNTSLLPTTSASTEGVRAGALFEDAPRKPDLGYHLLFERNPMPMWVYDTQTLRMLAVNEAALALYGYSRKAFVGLKLQDIRHGDDAVRHRNGDLIEVETVTEALEFEGVQARMVLVREMAKQRRAEPAPGVSGNKVAELSLLEEERETLAAVINAATDAIVSIDADGLIKMFNPGAERVFRRTRASMLGQSIEVLLPGRFRVAHAVQRLQFAESGATSRMMGLGLVKGLRSDGMEIDLEGTITQVTVQQQKMLIASMRDITDRVADDAEFQESRAQLSDLTQKLMTHERTLVKRLAQVLHDQLGQTLAAIRMCHETIITLQLDRTSSGIDQLQAQMSALIGHAIRQVRQVLMDLRPPLLEEQGLAAALDNELRNRSLMRPQLDISIDVPPKIALMRWPADVEYAAFMVAREAVENALRHSAASSVSVRLSGTATSMGLDIADNGVGITAGATPRSGHLGILGMHERANAIGATVTISSAEDEGTLVSFNWQHAS